MQIYANKNLKYMAIVDAPAQTYGGREFTGPHGSQSYFENLVEKLTVRDNSSERDLRSVLEEARGSLDMKDPAFNVLFANDFEQYVSKQTNINKWRKVEHDYNYYLRREVVRRDKNNPYFSSDFENVKSWDMLPDFSRQKRNQSWQFDHLNRDTQLLALEVYNITKDCEEIGDLDMFRAKINSILVPEKIIFALSVQDESFVEKEISLINIKLSLDGYKLAYVFLNRLIESLHKIGWATDQEKLKSINHSLDFADDVMEKLRLRIRDLERRFILYAEADDDYDV